jgi:hypothetical protein
MFFINLVIGPTAAEKAQHRSQSAGGPYPGFIRRLRQMSRQGDLPPFF